MVSKIKTLTSKPFRNKEVSREPLEVVVMREEGEEAEDVVAATTISSELIRRKKIDKGQDKT